MLLFNFTHHVQGPSDTMIVSMDALFGLPRKHSACTCFQEPLFRNVYFMDQRGVDAYVSAVGVKQSSASKV